MTVREEPLAGLEGVRCLPDVPNGTEEADRRLGERAWAAILPLLG